MSLEIDMYQLTAPVELPQHPGEKEAFLLQYAPKIANLYGHKFDATNPLEQIITARKANKIIFANENGKPIGLLAYEELNPNNPEHQGFFDSLKLENLAPHLYPDFLDEGGRRRVSDALSELTNWNMFGLHEKAIDEEHQGNGLSNDLVEATSPHIPKDKRAFLGDVQPIGSILPRTKLGKSKNGSPELLNGTFWGGEILRPDLPLPLDLTPEELRAVSLVLAHGFVSRHYPHALDVATGEQNFDKHGLLYSGAWDSHYKMPPLKWATNNPSLPQVQKATERLIGKQTATGRPQSGIAVTLVDSPRS